MLFKTLLGSTLIGTALLAAGAAHAGSTITINGVTIPIGLVAGGNQIDSAVLFETPVTAAGDIDTGVGFVTSINNAFGTQVWQNGDNGVELAYTFTYVASSVVAPTLTTNGIANFSSGSVDFYTLAAGTPINGLASIAADVAAVTSGTLFASTTAAKEDPAGDVLVSTIPAGTSLTAFAGGTGDGFLDVTGGPGGAPFETATFANPFDLTGSSKPGFSDLSFTSDFSTGAGGNFGISGSATLKGNAAVVPEPMSLALLGVGLAAMGVVGRRKR